MDGTPLSASLSASVSGDSGIYPERLDSQQGEKKSCGVSETRSGLATGLVCKTCSRTSLTQLLSY